METRTLQLHLSRLGYRVGGCDGIMGPKTRAALRAFQEASDIEPHGERTCETTHQLELAVSALQQQVRHLHRIDLGQLFPRFPAEWVEPMYQAMLYASITPERLPDWLAQTGHETAGFSTLEEGFGKRGPTDAYWRAYEPPRRVARQLGNTKPGDGYRYRGKGILQITGLLNHLLIAAILGHPYASQPDLLLQPEHGFLAGGVYWLHADCNYHVDRGDWRGLTRAINGGTNGLADRETWRRRARRIFG